MIRSFDSPDATSSLETTRPERNEEVFYYVEMTIGFEDEPATNLFGITVATPEALQAGETDDVILSDRALLVVSEFNWNAIRSHLEGIVEHCPVDSWELAVAHLRLYFQWEYDGYR